MSFATAKAAQPRSSEQEHFEAAEYTRAVLNVLEDSDSERARLLDAQRAVLNIVEDFGTEKARLLETQKAVLNILADLAGEKDRLERAQTEILRSEQALRHSLREKEVLLKEIHHRVKNNLQVISSLLVLQARHISDAETRDILSECQSRVSSIALVHEKLYQSPDLAHIELGDYVASLLESLFQTYDARGRGISHSTRVQARMTIDAVIPCGLIVNELVTNSLKHAFPGGRPGTVRVLVYEHGAGLEMEVSDDGVGLPPDLEPRKARSLGLDLVFTLAEQLEAVVQVKRGQGTTFRFSIARAR